MVKVNDNITECSTSTRDLSSLACLTKKKSSDYTSTTYQRLTAYQLKNSSDVQPVKSGDLYAKKPVYFFKEGRWQYVDQDHGESRGLTFGWVIGTVLSLPFSLLGCTSDQSALPLADGRLRELDIHDRAVVSPDHSDSSTPGDDSDAQGSDAAFDDEGVDSSTDGFDLDGGLDSTPDLDLSQFDQNIPKDYGVDYAPDQVRDQIVDAETSPACESRNENINFIYANLNSFAEHLVDIDAVLTNEVGAKVYLLLSSPASFIECPSISGDFNHDASADPACEVRHRSHGDVVGGAPDGEEHDRVHSRSMIDLGNGLSAVTERIGAEVGQSSEVNFMILRRGAAQPNNTVVYQSRRDDNAAPLSIVVNNSRVPIRDMHSLAKLDSVDRDENNIKKVYIASTIIGAQENPLDIIIQIAIPAMPPENRLSPNDVDWNTFKFNPGFSGLRALEMLTVGENNRLAALYENGPEDNPGPAIVLMNPDDRDLPVQQTIYLGQEASIQSSVEIVSQGSKLYIGSGEGDAHDPKIYIVDTSAEENPVQTVELSLEGRRVQGSVKDIDIEGQNIVVAVNDGAGAAHLLQVDANMRVNQLTGGSIGRDISGLTIINGVAYFMMQSECVDPSTPGDPPRVLAAASLSAD